MSRIATRLIRGDSLAKALRLSQVVTYMSIQAALKSLQGLGVLFPYQPSFTRSPPRRRLFLTARGESHRTEPQSATNVLCHKGLIHAALDRWVLGGRIYGERKTRYLSDLCPPPSEVWEVRVVEPRVQQARLFGRFAEPDTLILTAFHTRNLLGDKGSQAWTDAMADCVGQWAAFVPMLPIFSGASIHEYVTENCDDFPIKICTTNQPKPRKSGPGRIRRS